MKTYARILTAICLPLLSLSLFSCGGGGGSSDSQDTYENKAPETLFADKPQTGSGESTNTESYSTPLTGCDVTISAFDDTTADYTYAVRFTCTAEMPGIISGNITSCTLTITTPEGDTRDIQASAIGNWYNGLPSTNNLMRDLSFLYHGYPGADAIQLQIIINSMEVISRQNDAQGKLIALDAEIRSAEATIGLNAVPGSLTPINIPNGTRVRISYH